MRGVEQIPWLYDLGLAWSEALGLRRWRAWLAAGARGLTLDVGSGTGRTLRHLAPDARAIGVDPHRPNLVRARRRGPGVPLVLARAEALPFRDGAFDTVLCGLVLCSVEAPPRALAELRRVLRPGGTVRMIEHVRSTGLPGRVQDLVQPAWTWFTGGCHPNRETEAVVEASGFRIDETSRRSRGTLRRLEAHR